MAKTKKVETCPDCGGSGSVTIQNPAVSMGGVSFQISGASTTVTYNTCGGSGNVTVEVEE